MTTIDRQSSLKFGLWCNWIFVALTAVGWLGIATSSCPPAPTSGWTPPRCGSPRPTAGVIVRCTLFYIAAGILTPGSIAFGIMLSRIEDDIRCGRSPPRCAVSSSR